MPSYAANLVATIGDNLTFPALRHRGQALLFQWAIYYTGMVTVT
jgi:hypothetical protein